MRKLAKQYLGNDHIRIRIGRAGSTHGNVKQNVSAFCLFAPSLLILMTVRLG